MDRKKGCGDVSSLNMWVHDAAKQEEWSGHLT